MLRAAVALTAAWAVAAELPAWPHYPYRNVTVLDGEWQFGLYFNVHDATAVDPHTATPNSTIVPSAFDVAPPGYMGPRGTAFYRRNVTVTPNTPSLFNFGACAFYCSLYVDGRHQGDHRAGGYSPFWLTVEPSGRSVRDVLVVADNRWNSTTAPTHTGGDFYMFGGITRSVVVHEQPAAVYLQHIETYTTDWKACGVDVRVVVGGSFSTHTAVSLTLQWDGGVADGPFSGTPDASGGVWVRGAVVPKCSPWSPANPALHTVLVTLLAPGDDAEDGGAAAADAILVRFGVRQVGASGGRFTVNGEVVKLRGYNRHTMYPDTGSALTLAQVQEDAQLLASLHANWLRGAHYPQDQRLLDITDEMGIMVWEETLGPSVSVSDIEDPYFMQYHVQALNEMVSASFNHPSVVMHGFFNEGPSDDPRAIPGYNTSATVIRERTLGQKLVTWASDKKTSDVCLHLADVVSFNSYPAWYDHPGQVNETKIYWGQEATWVAANFPAKPFVVSETGAGGVYSWVNASDPFWSQGYQNEVVAGDTTTILNDPRFSGITLWQFADIKADDHSTVQCGPCELVPGSNPPDCAYVNVSCSRPGGENNKGSLDFWRRHKQVFATVAALYANVTGM